MSDEDDKVDLRQYKVPVWCPNCDGPMKGKSTATYYRYGVCQICWIEFIDGREERWTSGWRPTEDDMKAFSQKYDNSIYSSSKLPDTQ